MRAKLLSPRKKIIMNEQPTLIGIEIRNIREGMFKKKVLQLGRFLGGEELSVDP